MILTLISGFCLIALGMAGFLGWDKLGAEGSPAEMLMLVFFGGALVICVLFSRKHYRHGLYGAIIIAMLGVISAVVRVYQYEQFQSIAEPKTHLVLAMGGICLLQMMISWQEVQRDREVAPPI